MDHGGIGDVAHFLISPQLTNSATPDLGGSALERAQLSLVHGVFGDTKEILDVSNICACILFSYHSKMRFRKSSILRKNHASANFHCNIRDLVFIAACPKEELFENACSHIKPDHSHFLDGCFDPLVERFFVVMNLKIPTEGWPKSGGCGLHNDGFGRMFPGAQRKSLLEINGRGTENSNSLQEIVVLHLCLNELIVGSSRNAGIQVSSKLFHCPFDAIHEFAVRSPAFLDKIIESVDRHVPVWISAHAGIERSAVVLGVSITAGNIVISISRSRRLAGSTTIGLLGAHVAEHLFSITQVFS
eukprot:comp22544_c0_seq13/m.57574 comp22544_c0_seq13/g.57574  ORF comp22544_c0_seq13/g.57574 comp22544_c0_seq13/m.57574 type:complete len:302 (+) comp22544_c0_seq13:1256-2161(+)